MKPHHSLDMRSRGRLFLLFSTMMLVFFDSWVLAAADGHSFGGLGQDSKDSAQNATPQFDQKTLKRFTECLLHPPIKVLPPSFFVRNSTIYYYLGDVSLEDVIPTSATTTVPASKSDPLGITLKDQLLIELLREYVASPENGYLSFLQQSLLDADTEVSVELATIRNDQNDQKLLDKLDAHSEAIKEAIGKAVERYSLDHQLNVCQMTRKVLAATYQVTFLSEPSSGIISYVTEFDYQVATRRGLPPPWRVVVQASPIPLNAGSYHMHVHWPRPQETSGIAESEYPIDVLGDGIYKLRPLAKAI